jgi:hypothetical protein
MMMAKSSMTIKCTCVAAHFDGLMDVLVLCGVHPPMQHVQGYSGSHLTLPSGDYSLRIALAAAGVKANKTTMNMHQLFWPFQWPWWCIGTIPHTSPNGGGPGLH